MRGGKEDEGRRVGEEKGWGVGVGRRGGEEKRSG